MFCRVKSCSLIGVQSIEVDVEIHISPGLMQLNIVGLGDKAIIEAKERVRSALKSCGFEFPKRRITVNLSPSELKKSGSVFDLPIATGIIALIKNLQVPQDVVFLGELSLDGSVRACRGLLAYALGMHEAGYKKFVIPYENLQDFKNIKSLEIFPLEHISEIERVLNKKAVFIKPPDGLENFHQFAGPYIRVSPLTRLAMEACVAGQHHLLMVGPPGSGKSTIARALKDLLPPLSTEEALEVTRIYSACGINSGGLIYERPFRAPHHSASDVALVGGSSQPQPGEVSLAHRGILFLDELAEFSRKSLEALRQPMQEGQIHISRAEGKATFPARFTLVAATNPCLCGNYQNPNKRCVCTPNAIKSYQSKISGPLLDRFDIVIWINNPNGSGEMPSKERIHNALMAQSKRSGEKLTFNAHLDTNELKKHCKLSQKCEDILLKLTRARALSARAEEKLIKLSRTIADMELSENIKSEHLALAIALNTPWMYSSTF
ncbi:MAG: YifB family Mg chelatase-like AAA ATPase [Aquificaceae bacterium]